MNQRSRHSVTAVIIAALFSVMVPPVAAAQPIPKFRVGTPYKEVRQRLLTLGYRPHRVPTAGPGKNSSTIALILDYACFPEAAACGRTGEGDCLCTWEHGRKIISVVTHDGPPLF